jgi:nucleoside-diphosphate kinase
LLLGGVILFPFYTLVISYRSFCLIQQSGISVIGKVWQAIEASGLRVVGARMVSLSEEDAAYVSEGVGTRINGTVLGLSVAGEDSGDKVRTLASHIQERSGVPSTAVVPAVNEAASSSMITAFFGDSRSRMRSAKDLSGNFSSCTACMILPGALSNGHGGNILAEIQERCTSLGLTISALRMASFTRIEAEEFLEVYKGVVTEYVVSNNNNDRFLTEFCR